MKRLKYMDNDSVEELIARIKATLRDERYTDKLKLYVIVKTVDDIDPTDDGIPMGVV